MSVWRNEQSDKLEKVFLQRRLLMNLMNYVQKLAEIIFTVVLVMIVLPGGKVNAAPELTAENFDYDWYLLQHPDLAAAIPWEDHNAIWTFYKTIGEPAGWLGRCTKESYLSKRNLDYDSLLVLNPDVSAAFGADYNKIYDWYVSYGISEGRPVQSNNERINAQMKIYDIADRITDNSMSAREKIKAVHDWLCINVAYDYDNYLNDTIPDRSYDIEGPINYGAAVCDGYARTFLAFMEVLGIKCERIEGTANGGGHAWNKVKVDGIWHWIDVTWDDPVPDCPGIVYGYEYFLISEDQMNKDHTPD